MRRRYIVYFFIVVLVVSLFLPRYSVEAQTLNSMYSELKRLKKERNEINNQKKMTENDINKLSDEIVNTGTLIERTREEIKKASSDIDESLSKIESKKEESMELLKFLQLSSGENVYLDYVLSSTDYTDFVYRYSVVSQLANYNNALISELESLVKELENKKVTLNSKEMELNSKKDELASKQAILNSQFKEIREGYVDINEEIASLQKSISYYEKLGCKGYQDVSTCTSLPYADGFKYPLKSGYISSGYGKRTYWLRGRLVSDYHYGFDMAGNAEGTYVYAAAPGKVIDVKYKSTCGGNQVFIAHRVNGKNYTTTYAHMLSISVEKNQVVTAETVIGKVGGYSTSYQHGGYDYCTTGAHLHFGIADGHRSTSFSANSFSPRSIFPKINYGLSFSYR